MKTMSLCSLNARSQDSSNTETITYELEAVQSDGKFELPIKMAMC